MGIWFTPSWSQTTIQLDSTVLQVDTLLTGLNVPWEIVWGPDEQIWFTERHGTINRLDPVTGQRTTLLNYMDKVYQSGESGMLGLFLHPDFAVSPFVYTAYTYRDNGQTWERIVRFDYQNDTLVNEDVLVDQIPANTTHDGCRFLLLPDKTLLVTTGDARNDAASQMVSSLNGKILRMNLDGTIPTDNPNATSYVWAWGIRNTQGLTLGKNNLIYGSEHGPSNDDEVNVLEKGRNYGWPSVAGFCNSSQELAFCNDSNVKEPMINWTPTIAPSDLIYYTHSAIPEWTNKLLMTVLKDKMLVAMPLSTDGTKITGQTSYIKNYYGRLRDICTDGKGAIYLATNGQSWSNVDPYTHSIIKLWNPSFISVKPEPITSPLIYPNPGRQSFQVRDPDHEWNRLEIFTADGIKVHELNLTDDLPYPTQRLTIGVYLIRLSGKNGTYTQRWVKLE